MALFSMRQIVEWNRGTATGATSQGTNMTDDRRKQLAMEVVAIYEKADGDQEWPLGIAGLILEKERVANRVREEMKAIPFKTDYRANRYDTDDEMVLHIWDEEKGVSYDIRVLRRG